MDPIAKMKEAAREGWSTFAPFETMTGSVAPILVKFAGINEGDCVLDVACGTGVVALCMARVGAEVTGLDLTPALLARAAENAALANVTVEFREGDVENLPFNDASFDHVVSQFGHMFGPRPVITVSEMLRVLKPGGLFILADSAQFGDYPALDGLLEYFPHGFHEPYYKNYLSWNANSVCEAAGLLPETRSLAFLTKISTFRRIS